MRLITDIKSDNLKGLERIASSLSPFQSRIIPQIYEPEEYARTRALGFRQIIYATYKTWKNYFQVLKFSAETDLFGVSVPKHRLTKFNLRPRLSRLGVAVFTHTVNSIEEVGELRRQGVVGFFTDTMSMQEFE